MKYLEFQKKIGDEENINCNMIFKGNSGTRKNYDDQNYGRYFIWNGNY